MEEINLEQYGKTFWQSDTIRLAVGSIIAAIFAYFTHAIDLQTMIEAIVVSGMGITLRKGVGVPIVKTGDAPTGNQGGSARIGALMMLVLGTVLTLSLMASGCATGTAVRDGKVSAANTAVMTAEVTNASIDGLAALAEAACQDGTISPSDCARIQAVYDKVRSADSAALHILAASIEAGEDPQASADYHAAMAELGAAVKELFTLADQLGLVKQ